MLSVGRPFFRTVHYLFASPLLWLRFPQALPQVLMTTSGKTMNRIRTFFVAVLLVGAPFCAARDLAVIINKSNPASTVTAADLEKLLKAATQTWPNGIRVKVILTDPSAADSRMLLQR